MEFVLIEAGKQDKYVDSKIDVHQTKQGGELVYTRQRIYDSEKTAQVAADQLKLLQSKLYRNLIPVYQHESKSERQFCFTHFRVQEWMLYLPNSLENMLENPNQPNQQLSQQDLVTLLYQSLSGLAFLHNLGIFHENVSLCCIRLSQMGFALHYDPLNEKSGFHHRDHWSPERLRNGTNLDKNKVDVYALGIALLKAGTRQKELSAPVEVELTKLQQLIPENQLYSSTVRQMLVSDPSYRMDSLSLISGLPPFNQIKSFFSAKGPGGLHEQAEVPRFWMEPNHAERASYLAPMKQTDGPSRFVAQGPGQMKPQTFSNNRLGITSSSMMIPQIPVSQPPQQQTVQKPPIIESVPQNPGVEHIFEEKGRDSILLEDLAEQFDEKPSATKSVMVAVDKTPVRKSVVGDQSNMKRTTARSSALAFAPNLQKIPEEIVRAENMRSIPEGQTRMVAIQPVKHLDRTSVLNLLQEIADKPTDFDTEVEQYSGNLKGDDKYFITPQGQVFRKEETVYKTFDPIEGEKYIVKVQYMPDSSQTKQMNRFRYEKNSLPPYYMPAWPKYTINRDSTSAEFYPLEQDSLQLDTQSGTVYVDQHGNQFLSVPVP